MISWDSWPHGLWLKWGVLKLGRHICSVPSPSCLAPRVPNWQTGSPPPPNRAVFLGKGLICFLPQSSCCCLLGREGWLFPK